MSTADSTWGNLEMELLSEIEWELKTNKPGICLIAEPWSFEVAYLRNQSDLLCSLE